MLSSTDMHNSMWKNFKGKETAKTLDGKELQESWSNVSFLLFCFSERAGHFLLVTAYFPLGSVSLTFIWPLHSLQHVNMVTEKQHAADKCLSSALTCSATVYVKYTTVDPIKHQYMSDRATCTHSTWGNCVSAPTHILTTALLIPW